MSRAQELIEEVASGALVEDVVNRHQPGLAGTLHGKPLGHYEGEEEEDTSGNPYRRPTDAGPLSYRELGRSVPVGYAPC